VLSGTIQKYLVREWQVVKFGWFGISAGCVEIAQYNELVSRHTFLRPFYHFIQTADLCNSLFRRSVDGDQDECEFPFFDLNLAVYGSRQKSHARSRRKVPAWS